MPKSGSLPLPAETAASAGSVPAQPKTESLPSSLSAPPLGELTLREAIRLQQERANALAAMGINAGMNAGRADAWILALHQQQQQQQHLAGAGAPGAANAFGGPALAGLHQHMAAMAALSRGGDATMSGNPSQNLFGAAPQIGEAPGLLPAHMSLAAQQHPRISIAPPAQAPRTAEDFLAVLRGPSLADLAPRSDPPHSAVLSHPRLASAKAEQAAATAGAQSTEPSRPVASRRERSRSKALERSPSPPAVPVAAAANRSRRANAGKRIIRDPGVSDDSGDESPPLRVPKAQRTALASTRQQAGSAGRSARQASQRRRSSSPPSPTRAPPQGSRAVERRQTPPVGAGAEPSPEDLEAIDALQALIGARR